nr:LuxR C-terminal-related transcriptional regulator [uncultured Slackia sp.]
MALTLGKRLTDGVRRSKAAEDVSRASATTDAFSNDSELLKADEASGPSQADTVAASVGTTGLPKGFSDAARLDRQCAGVAKHYGLTARETEVMTLLAHGRDVAFIAEELTLSKNTVRTHTKGVFSKMGVHSKQELIDVVYLYEE